MPVFPSAIDYKVQDQNKKVLWLKSCMHNFVVKNLQESTNGQVNGKFSQKYEIVRYNFLYLQEESLLDSQRQEKMMEISLQGDHYGNKLMVQKLWYMFFIVF